MAEKTKKVDFVEYIKKIEKIKTDLWKLEKSVYEYIEWDNFGMVQWALNVLDNIQSAAKIQHKIIVRDMENRKWNELLANTESKDKKQIKDSQNRSKH